VDEKEPEAVPKKSHESLKKTKRNKMIHSSTKPISKRTRTRRSSKTKSNPKKEDNCNKKTRNFEKGSQFNFLICTQGNNDDPRR
jgi:hypothetical protein